MAGTDGGPRRYARALFDVALQKGEEAGLRDELDAATRVLQGSRELQQTLDHPALPLERKKKILGAVFAGRGSALLLKLLELLVQRRRTSVLPALARTYTALFNAHRGVLAAEAVSAAPLSAEQQAAIQAALQEMTGKPVELGVRTEPALLGGVVVNMDGRTYDGTVRTRLTALREHLGGRAV
jgi:F-type H+-transporting ATPase subunit delta